MHYRNRNLVPVCTFPVSLPPCLLLKGNIRCSYVLVKKVELSLSTPWRQKKKTSRRTAPYMPNLSTRRRRVASLTTRQLYPRVRTHVPSEYEAEWAPQRFWAIRRRWKFLVTAQIWTPHRSARSIYTPIFFRRKATCVQLDSKNCQLAQ